MDELFTPYHTPFSSAPLSPDPGLRVYLLSRQIIADNTLRVSEQNYDVGAKLVSNKLITAGLSSCWAEFFFIAEFLLLVGYHDNHLPLARHDRKKPRLNSKNWTKQNNTLSRS